MMISIVSRTLSRNTLVNKTSSLIKQAAYFSKTSERNVKETRSFSAEFSSIDPSEVDKFRSLSAGWWNQNGDFKALHSLNEIRVPFIRDGIISASKGIPEITAFPLSGYEILDVGCGGGILSEALGRLGADVTGVDVGYENINVANYHLGLNPELKDKISYIEGSVEQSLSSQQMFDAIVVSEVLEHVLKPKEFIKFLMEHLKPGGSVFITTINRNIQSWLLGIVAAEYILRIVPPGTHDWNKFLTPQEVKGMLNSCNVNVSLVHGMCYNVATSTWSWSANTSLNYAIHGVKVLETKNGDVTIIEGKYLESPRTEYLLKTEATGSNCPGSCIFCQYNLNVRHTDVLILSQYCRSDGRILPARITGLCSMMQKRIGELITMAQKAGLMSNLTPSRSNKNPRLREKWKSWNTYYVEEEHCRKFRRSYNLMFPPNPYGY